MLVPAPDRKPCFPEGRRFRFASWLGESALVSFAGEGDYDFLRLRLRRGEVCELELGSRPTWATSAGLASSRSYMLSLTYKNTDGSHLCPRSIIAIEWHVASSRRAAHSVIA